MSAPLLDLVAVTYEARNETSFFLDSLVHIDVPYRLIIIDNASLDDGVRDVITSRIPLAFGNCIASSYRFNQENVGYARAINQGMRLFDEPAPYAAILNADTEFLPGESIRSIIEFFEMHERVGVVGPRTYNSNRKMTHAGIVTTLARPMNHHRGWLLRDHPRYQDTMSVNTVSGATYFVRRATWDELSGCPAYQQVCPGAEGAFLPTKHFYEETFCSYHARQHGWDVIYLGSVAMIHQWHRSSVPGSQPLGPAREMFLAACAGCGISTRGET